MTKLSETDQKVVDDLLHRALLVLGLTPADELHSIGLSMYFETHWRMWNRHNKSCAELMRYAYEVLKPFASEEKAPMSQVIYSEAERRLALFNSLATNNSPAQKIFHEFRITI